MAANNEHIGVFKFLLENVEDIKIRKELLDSYGERVLYLAAQQENSECFEFFLLHIDKEKIPELTKKINVLVSQLIQDNIDDMINSVRINLEVLKEINNFLKISKDPFKDMQDLTGLPPEIIADILHKSLKVEDKISVTKVLNAAVSLHKMNEDVIEAKKYDGSQEEEVPIKNIKAKTKFIEIYGKLREEKESKSIGRERS